MVTFKELIKNVTFNDVINELVYIYKDQEKNVKEYKKVFFKLLQMEPIPNDDKWKIFIQSSTEEYEEDGKTVRYTYFDLFGKKAKRKDKFGLEFMSWDQWLSMNIDSKTLKNFTYEQIIAHCLWEMTFISFDEKDIEQAIDDLTDTIEEIDKQIAEEKAGGKKADLVSWEEFKQKLNDEYGDDKNDK